MCLCIKNHYKNSNELDKFKGALKVYAMELNFKKIDFRF